MLIATVEWFSGLPHVSYRIPGPPAWLWVAFFAAFVALAAGVRAAAARRQNRLARRQLSPPVAPIEWASAAALAALTVLVATHPFRPELDAGQLEVTVLDVGQGDSIFAAFPGGRTMLVDGGGLSGSEWVGGYRSGTDIGEQVVSPYLWSRGLKRLDVVALTHADHDHLDGLYSVLENFPVRELWIGGDDPKPEFQRLVEEARSRGVVIVRQSEGGRFEWQGVEGSILWPPDGASAGKSNNNSLVMRLSDGRTNFLLTGDIEKQAEEGLLAQQSQEPLAADFLKVPHHGSKTSSSEAFLDAVAPHFAAVSVGESNAFGHPAEEVVERYRQDGVDLLRTDQEGAITALSDGQRLSVRAYATGTADLATEFESPRNASPRQASAPSGQAQTR